jgi:hypothetical protein
MNRTILSIVTVFGISIAVNGDQKALTATGEEVILHDNGKWTYANKTGKTKTPSAEIKLNKNKFVKSQNATFPVKSKINDSVFYINPKKWTFAKGTEDAEYDFELKGKDLYGTVITEEISMSPETIANLAFSNIKEGSSGAKILQKEYRIVNGVKMIFMKMQATVEGIKLVYFGYYYANRSGTTQFILYTGENLADKYKTEIDEFLNGFVVKKSK